jgi:type II secretory pathway component PulF
MSLARFEYAAVNTLGVTASGVIESATTQDAYRTLAARGLTPLYVRESRAHQPLFSFGTIRADDITGFTRELSVLLDARIPLDRGLASIANHHEKPALRTIVREIAQAVESGIALTEAMSRHPHLFSEVYVETIRAAERTGNLGGIVAHLADLLERRDETRRMLKRALTYPAIVTTIILAAIIVIFVFVIPRFSATFQAQGVTLPAVTRIVQSVASSFTTFWYLYAAAVLTGSVALALMWRTVSGRLRLEHVLYRTPYLGTMLVSDLISRFGGIMSIGLASGLDVIDSLAIAGRSTGSRLFSAHTTQMAERLRGGASLPGVLDNSTLIPSFARRMIVAGKDAKELSKACDAVGRHYERRATHLMRNINTIIEPILTVALAGIVLVVALSVFLPMWEMIRVKR